MMKPRGAGAWWTAAVALALLAAGLALFTIFDVRTPMTWLIIGIAVAAMGCAVMAVRTAHRPG